jgi:uncharacterized protein (TIGR01777 family)
VSTAPVVLTGATGLVGSALAQRLRAEGRALRLVSRSPGRIAAEPGVEAVGWDGISLPAEALDGAGAVVHLAGEPIFGGRPTRARRARIWSSRVDSTKALVQRLAELPAGRRPGRLVCASAVGYYGDRGEEELTDASPPGSGFLADLCVAWEAEARRAAELGVRVASLRFGVVLARAGGALAALARVFGLGLGGRLGDGRQWLSWIHLADAVGLAQRALEDVDFTGAFAAVAPAPVRNEAFTRELARVLGRPALLPAPAFAVRLALGELAGELLGSRRVLPARAQALGHRFAHPELASALTAELR